MAAVKPVGGIPVRGEEIDLDDSFQVLKSEEQIVFAHNLDGEEGAWEKEVAAIIIASLFCRFIARRSLQLTLKASVLCLSASFGVVQMVVCTEVYF